MTKMITVEQSPDGVWRAPQDREILPITASEIEFAQGREAIRDQIAEALALPPELLTQATRVSTGGRGYGKAHALKVIADEAGSPLPPAKKDQTRSKLTRKFARKHLKKAGLL